MAESQPKALSEVQIPHGMINWAARPRIRQPNDSPLPELVDPTPQLDILSTLANELLVLIATFVHTPQPWRSNDFYNQQSQPYNTKDVLNLALCSRHLYNVTEFVFYRFFRVPALEDDKAAQGASLQLFMCRILERPQLAICVRGFHAKACCGRDGYLNMACIKDDDWSRVHAAIWDTGISLLEKSKWYDEIRKGDWDSVISLVLSLLPNLEQLEFDRWTYERIYPRLMNFLSSSSELQNNSKHTILPLKSLRKITLLGVASLSQCESFLQLKSVDDFYAECINMSLNGTVEEERLNRYELRAFIRKRLTFTSGHFQFPLRNSASEVGIYRHIASRIFSVLSPISNGFVMSIR